MTTTERGHSRQTVEMDRNLVADRYRLHERIGHGRLGDIYEAVDEGHQELGVGQHVAIQLLPDRIALNQGIFNKLKLGYTVLRAVSHPNIVTFIDLDHDGKFGYLVMELLDGASLRLVLDDVTTLPLDEAIPVIRAVGDALQLLHAKSIVHGQLTAENVFFTQNLEVRLLDVVPLDSASTILRGVASREPLSRCDIGDDVYALACLAYEMLAGRHPFNFQTPAEARLAGLEPAGIDSLPERQWNAICRALSFDREERTSAVADFLGEFGITGTERLRRSEDATPATHSADPSRSAHSSDHFTDKDADDRPIRRKIVPDVARAKRKRAKRIPSPILLMALVGLGIWFFFGNPHDDVANLIDYVDSNLGVELAESNDGSLPIIVGAPAPTASQDAGPTILLPDPPPETVTDDNADTETTVDNVVAGRAAGSEATPSRPADEPLADPRADTRLSSATEFTLIESFVTISERDGAARITARRPAITADRFVWWTSDDTAIANEDYIPIGQPVVGFASGEEAETLHIPLINDSLPEPQETFYVFLGRHNAQLGRLEPIMRIRVDINDDE